MAEIKKPTLGHGVGADPENLSKFLGYKFTDPTLLFTALTHKSRLENGVQKSSHGPNNERLEFLGDAVLSLVTANYLYQQHNFMNEGDLSRLRAQFVCEQNLSLAAKALDLGRYILSDRAMRASGSTYSNGVLADTLEALVGAVFLDGGLQSAEKAIFKLLGYPNSKISSSEKDAKTRLQEMVQANFKDAPKYVVLESHGPPHAPTFLVGVKIQDEVLAKATGESKKRAAQNAAVLALEILALESEKGKYSHGSESIKSTN